MLRIGHVHVGNDIDDAAVGLFRQALIFTTVTGFHVEDGNMQPLCTDDRQAAVGIAQHQYGVWLDSNHQLIAFGDDIAHRLTQVCTHGIHIYFRICQL